jgi:predicted DNA-binding transcriptional regulator AlpA
MPKKGPGYGDPTQTQQTAFRCDPVTPEARLLLHEMCDPTKVNLPPPLTTSEENDAPVEQSSGDRSAKLSTNVRPAAETCADAISATPDKSGTFKCPTCGASTGPPNTSQSLSDHRLLRLKQIIAPLGPLPVSRSTFLLRVKQGVYPKPCHPSPGVSAWWQSEILELLRRIGDG